MAGGAVLVVRCKVAETEELEAVGSGAVLERLFHLAAGENFERVGVQAVDEVLAGGVRFGIGEEHIVEPDLGVGAVVRVHPVDRSAHLAPVGRVAAAGLGVVFAEDLRHVAVRVLHAAGAADDVGAFEAHLVARIEAVILLDRLFHEIVLLDPERAGERDRARAGVFGDGVILNIEKLGLSLGIVRDRELHGTEHRHDALGVRV